MTSTVRLECLSDLDDFRRRRSECWERNAAYWLASELRHVCDVGDYIVGRTADLLRESGAANPLLCDMGCGSAWLLESVSRQPGPFRYLGLDAVHQFVDQARQRYSGLSGIEFELVDLERPLEETRSADVVVNAFSFFEFCDLRTGFLNAARLLAPRGTLMVSTIDKTFLLLAISQNWEDFIEKLRLYQVLPGTKYAFQPIDLGNGVSQSLVYPSVMYSTENYIDAAKEAGMKLTRYREDVFTAKHVPKIYNHLEFVRA